MSILYNKEFIPWPKYDDILSHNFDVNHLTDDSKMILFASFSEIAAVIYYVLYVISRYSLYCITENVLPVL